MRTMRRIKCVSQTVLFLCLVAANVSAQEFTPSIGQEGKDVIWVPTPDSLIEAMLDMAKVTPQDRVYDLGSGDGRIVIAAARRGARATGIEFNGDMVALSRRGAETAGVADKATFVQADIFESDFRDATVLTMYMLQHLTLTLRPAVLDLKPGTRVVSHAFTMEDWAADQTVEQEGRTAYLWVVPAKVEGTWKCGPPSEGGEIVLTQRFQEVRGVLKKNGAETALRDVELRGNRIHFTVNGAAYDGAVNGRTMEGTVTADARQGRWLAERVE